jgi:hypothetical protein
MYCCYFFFFFYLHGQAHPRRGFIGCRHTPQRPNPTKLRRLPSKHYRPRGLPTLSPRYRPPQPRRPRARARRRNSYARLSIIAPRTVAEISAAIWTEISAAVWARPASTPPGRSRATYTCRCPPWWWKPFHEDRRICCRRSRPRRLSRTPHGFTPSSKTHPPHIFKGRPRPQDRRRLQPPPPPPPPLLRPRYRHWARGTSGVQGCTPCTSIMTNADWCLNDARKRHNARRVDTE